MTFITLLLYLLLLQIHFMAYDKYLAERIIRTLKELKADFSYKPMMGGLLFSVEDKMLCGIHHDKKYGDNLLMCRIGEDAYVREIAKDVCLPMDFTGRPMKGYIFVTPEGYDMDSDLEYWLQLALAFNPFAKSSKKRKS